MIKTLRERSSQLNAERDTLFTSTEQLAIAIGELREEYQARASHAYKYGRLHDVALIMAAQSINQMLIRVRYLHRFTEQRRDQLGQIAGASTALQDRRATLESMVTRNETLLLEAEQEQQMLSKLQKDRRQMVDKLRSQTVNLEKNLQENRTTAQQLQSRIQALIAAETARRERVASPVDLADFTALTGSFQQNRGSLPWPSTGTVIEPYGEIVNPVHGTKTQNLGLVIATQPSAEVRVVFEGTVSSIDIMPDLGIFVIIEHGDYHSVYGNFSLTYVAQGDRVKAGQVIGRSGTDAEPKGQAVFFGLFQNGKPLDPNPWLK